MDILGTKIRQERKKLNFSQQQLADRLNVCHSVISHYETGRSSPDIITIIRMCEIFKLTLNDFVQPENPKNSLTLSVNEPTREYLNKAAKHQDKSQIILEALNDIFKTGDFEVTIKIAKKIQNATILK